MGWAVARDQAGPVRLAEDEIVDGAEHTLSATMRESHGFVLQCRDADGAKRVPNLFGITAKIVVVTVGVPGTERRPRKRRQGIEKRAHLAGMASHDVTRDGYQVRLELHQR